MIVAIIQARTGSSRLPNKVLSEVAGTSLLELYVNRVRKCLLLDKIVIATTNKQEDGAIELLANHIGIEVYRGSENDLLDRYYKCAIEHKAEVVVRLTPDDCFVDPPTVDRAVQIFKDNKVDFVTNHFDPTFPEGLDVEVYSINALKKSWELAKLASEREHVFPYIQNNQEQFKIINFKQDINYSHLRWTIDYECDLDMMKVVYNHLYGKNPCFQQDDIISLLEEHPEIATINSHIKRKEGVNKTKAMDNNTLNRKL
jgi:spore coat polysaccharide biosynthesis protein SpsF (cytidylyltransferase family)